MLDIAAVLLYPHEAFQDYWTLVFFNLFHHYHHHHQLFGFRQLLPKDLIAESYTGLFGRAALTSTCRATWWHCNKQRVKKLTEIPNLCAGSAECCASVREKKFSTSCHSVCIVRSLIQNSVWRLHLKVSLYYTNPNNANYYTGKLPHTHTFDLHCLIPLEWVPFNDPCSSPTSSPTCLNFDSATDTPCRIGAISRCKGHLQKKPRR